MKIRDKKTKRIITVIVAAVILCIVSALSVSAYVESSTKDYILSREDLKTLDADCILVLSKELDSDRSLNDLLEDRLKIGIELYKDKNKDVTNKNVTKLLFSGDHGKNNKNEFKGYDEVNPMREFAEKRGVPAKDIFLDHAGFCIYDSMYRAKNIFKCERVIIIAQSDELQRAVCVAKKLDLKAYGLSLDDEKYDEMEEKGYGEILKRDRDCIKAFFKCKSKIVGKEEYPISGDGRTTHDK